MGAIYMFINNVNGKRYVGKTHRDIERRKREHIDGRGSRLLKESFDKYGIENFTFEILHDGISDERLDDYEIEAIKKYNCVAPNGYNLTWGGEGEIPSDESRRKMSEAKKGRQKGEKNPFYGKKHSEETRRKLSEFAKNRSEDYRLKISKALKGKKIHSEESRRKISDATKGENNPNFGKPISEEHRRKLSKRMSGKNHPFYGKKRPEHAEKMSGKNNPNYGKSWTRSEASKRKQSKAMSGKNNPFYRQSHSEGALCKMRKPEYYEAKWYFVCDLHGLPLKEKRKQLRIKYPNIHRDTILNWTKQWESED